MPAKKTTRGKSTAALKKAQKKVRVETLKSKIQKARSELKRLRRK